MARTPSTREGGTSTAPAIQNWFSRRLSWGALFAGVVVAASVQLLLTVFGTGIGAVSVSGVAPTAARMGIGAGIWLVVSSLLAFYCGGWASGRLAGIPRTVESTMHGFMTWGLAMVVGSMMVTSAVGGLLGGAANMIGRPAATSDSAGPSSVAGGRSGRAGDGGEIASASARRASATAVGAQPDEQQPISSPAKPTATSSLSTFIVMLLGAGAAALGGFVSTPKNRILTSLPAWDRRASR